VVCAPDEQGYVEGRLESRLVKTRKRAPRRERLELGEGVALALDLGPK
jgi:hypothetical protein